MTSAIDNRKREHRKKINEEVATLRVQLKELTEEHKQLQQERAQKQKSGQSAEIASTPEVLNQSQDTIRICEKVSKLQEQLDASRQESAKLRAQLQAVNNMTADSPRRQIKLRSGLSIDEPRRSRSHLSPLVNRPCLLLPA